LGVMCRGLAGIGNVGAKKKNCSGGAGPVLRGRGEGERLNQRWGKVEKAVQNALGGGGKGGQGRVWGQRVLVKNVKDGRGLQHGRSPDGEG